ncbi:hypothetical protein WA1_47195 [Scytonema hofmannii PCC 7110]|uniref:Uncharacterized protein n=1 Tax=Scytonema hofmannii PCC 7110 TaxID=128403 RepID=A0A139WXR0_9CYAN|nr:hypothetical protein [Scytonema hofmannii]KYC37216.1 hypothetical protein WA1_47195 [Scytonema hofmannii PCC 7110]
MPVEGLFSKALVYYWDISVVCEVTPEQFDAITSGRQQWSEVYLNYPGIKPMTDKVKICSKAGDRVFY